ncbi:MAG: divalent-cation tolerance protein CutA [Bacteroidota bacterium]|nr:divalent-cation tolerance protein CutA [Bacteroidota bacterium]
MTADTPCLIITTTASADEADAIARALVDERLVACCSVSGPVRSTYRWEGRTVQDEERMLFMKTIRQRYPDVESRIRALHSYEIPEIICLPVQEGFEPYLRWLHGSVVPEGSAEASPGSTSPSAGTTGKNTFDGSS